MSRFLILTSKIINPRFISHIDLKPRKYEIVMSHQVVDGTFFVSSGVIDTIEYKIQVDEEKEPSDYASVTQWLTQNVYLNGK